MFKLFFVLGFVVAAIPLAILLILRLLYFAIVGMQRRWPARRYTVDRGFLQGFLKSE